MYGMYPDSWGTSEWGPAAHNPDNPQSVENVMVAVGASFDQRDGDGARPDDN